ncbi:MAG: hypothetical protein QOK06_2677, partial [Acidimicrobiaceae bacterium]
MLSGFNPGFAFKICWMLTLI